MQTNHHQEQVLRDARLRHRISEALSRVTESLPPQAALNLLPLLQQGRAFLNSVSSVALRSGLLEVSGFLAQGHTADDLLPMIGQAERSMTAVQRIVAAPMLRGARRFLTNGDSRELATWCAELREVVDEVLTEDALPPLVLA